VRRRRGVRAAVEIELPEGAGGRTFITLGRSPSNSGLGDPTNPHGIFSPIEQRGPKAADDLGQTGGGTWAYYLGCQRENLRRKEE
jgi:hypothetical protein